MQAKEEEFIHYFPSSGKYSVPSQEAGPQRV